MNIICPTITAYDPHEYRAQMERIVPFAKRIHIDLMDGDFAPTKSPGLEQVWWPHEIQADIHLMYRRPMDHLEQLLKLKPRMVVIHNEADVHHMHFVAELHKENILAGLAVLQETPIEHAYQIMHSFDHVLVFSGQLGYHGGEADLGLLDKVKKIREHHVEVEIGWDGGITDANARQLVVAGVDVLNVGGFVQRSENPQDAYDKLLEVIGT
jgi:ribulose-phosphate 3-epimerase